MKHLSESTRQGLWKETDASLLERNNDKSSIKQHQGMTIKNLQNCNSINQNSSYVFFDTSISSSPELEVSHLDIFNHITLF